MKIIFIGNCQVEYLAKRLSCSEGLYNSQLLCPKPVYLINEGGVNQLHKDILSCDILITQPIENEYRNNIGVGTKFLKSLLPNHSTTSIIPNLYFAGYFPTFGYLKNEKGETATASADIWNSIPRWLDYHDYLILASVSSGLSFDNFYTYINSDIKVEIFSTLFESSLQELKLRDNDCDVLAHPILEYFNFDVEMFNSFNHSTNKLLQLLACEIAKKLNLEFKSLITDDEEFLPFPKLPVYPVVLSSLNKKNDKSLDHEELESTYFDYEMLYKGNNTLLKLSSNFSNKNYINALDIINKT
jgi:hypothetical protein